MHCHSKREEVEQWGKSKPKQDWNRAGQILTSLLRWPFRSWFPSCDTFLSLLGWFHNLSVVIFGRYPSFLEFSTTWCLQCNPGFAVTASNNGLSGSPGRNWLTSLTLVSFFINSEPQMARVSKFCCLFDLDPGPFLELDLHKLPLVADFYWCISFLVYKFQVYLHGSCPYGTPPFILFSIMPFFKLLIKLSSNILHSLVLFFSLNCKVCVCVLPCFLFSIVDLHKSYHL